MQPIEKINKSLAQAIEIVGLIELGRQLGVNYQAIYNWQKRGMPKSEFACETRHAEKIEKLTKRAVTVEDLLGFRPPCLRGKVK